MDSSLKSVLKALSLELRHTLEGRYSEDGAWHAGDLESRLNQIGIWRDRPVKPVSEMPNLSPVDRHARELIDAYLALRNDAGVSQSDAVAEFIRESAHTWANRLFALRCMEARGIIDPVVLQEETYQGRSMVHNRFAQRNPGQCTGDDDGLFAMLSEEFRERSLELPDLFSPDSPAIALRPSVAALKRCISMLSGTIPANGGKVTDEVFTAPDAFGWAYQYWNTEEKGRVFEMVRTKKGAKIEGSDIIPATQLYTEPYMVKFLVQNSLGATWMMMHPESKLSAAWEYYVKDADRTPNEKKPIAEITFLDPACGSGHFLIEAFDLLYAMYEEEGSIRDPAGICRSILNNNLFGIDIDERAVQITKAVLWMKAAESVFAKTKQQLTGEGLSEFHDHIIATNIRLPKSKDHLDAFLKKHPEDAPLRPALITVFEGLQNVHELGSLVQIEEPVEKELKVLKEQAKQQKFDPQSGEIVEKVNFSRWKQQVMKRLKAHFQDEAEKALPTEAFFSQSAVKGLALFDLLARRYDVVAANPPYMGSGNMGPWIKRYTEANYTEGKADLFAAFILRDLQLTQKNGRIAMVTQQSWMFRQSYSKLRVISDLEKNKRKKGNFSGILIDTSIETLIHLGEHAFNDSAAAGAFVVLFTYSNSIPQVAHNILGLRLIGPKSSDEKERRLRKILKNSSNQEIFFTPQRKFSELPNATIAYWLPKELLEILVEKVQLKDYCYLVEPTTTGNNDRFFRTIWEIRPNSRWIISSKGGGHSRWYGLINYCIDWDHSGARIKAFPHSYLRNEEFLFKKFITFTQVARGSMGARYMPPNSIFGKAGPGIIPKSQENYDGTILFLNSRLCSYLLRTLITGLSFNVGNLAVLPASKLEQINKNHELCNFILAKKAELASSNILEYNSKIGGNIQFLSLRDIIKEFQITQFELSSIIGICEGINDRSIFDFYSISSQTVNSIFSETGNPSGWFPILDNYSKFPLPLHNTEQIPSILNIYLNKHKTLTLHAEEVSNIKKRLYSFFESGQGITEESTEDDTLLPEGDDESISVGAYIPIPPETFLEELSQKMEIHPISIYWLLKEGIEKEGWRCIPEEKRYTEDLFTVMVLRLLGHRWPKQIESGEPVPEWADPDGIISITSGLMHPTLVQQVRDRIAVEFPGGKVHEIEKEFEEVVGMPLERWLAGEFFRHHISQFKKRPIAWQLSSSPSGTNAGKGKGRGSRREPAFSCLVYYHKIDADILHKIRTQYVGDLINRYGTELRALEGRKEPTGDQASRKVQLDNWIAELKDFSQVLQDVADTGFDSATLREIIKKEPLDKWTSRDGKSPQPRTGEEFYAQEKRYDPDINGGVRVNIAPLQKAGLLAAEVIAKKDVEKAIADRAEWRADERRWCREGKLPKCGWWD